ncbi:hypothetical protein CIB48_g10749 [Xylaria polymorpha]|nr:hypothetical protein CIB48_g10749 [Xylaria polymorpha]
MNEACRAAAKEGVRGGLCVSYRSRIGALMSDVPDRAVEASRHVGPRNTRGGEIGAVQMCKQAGVGISRGQEQEQEPERERERGMTKSEQEARRPGVSQGARRDSCGINKAEAKARWSCRSDRERDVQGR